MAKDLWEMPVWDDASNGLLWHPEGFCTFGNSQTTGLLDAGSSLKSLLSLTSHTRISWHTSNFARIAIALDIEHA